MLFKAIDATLGVDGLPQSGTGQTALLAGFNAAALHGRHQPHVPPVALRALLAERFRSRGLDCEAGDLLVTTGSQQALGLVSTVLVDLGDVVLVENPSYLAALQCFGFAGARLVAVPCDEQGLEPDALPALIAEHRPKFLYLVPTFQ
ncbi:MAG: aminotransferase class I/II-fold pyridoxal phosphate-dependent enzyme, partial [Chloroflexota bacterium]|nr:aminotransferase class I/II-fold pyridoxal phosphate-dependent enzyme [Chloroflexota bacterium]